MKALNVRLKRGGALVAGGEVGGGLPYVLPEGEVIWKQYRRSSHSTAITELLSRSSTMPPATAPRGWHMRFPPWVKK